jgi:predicted Zn-ribbon and HTH transcriptional regulator
MAYLTILGLGGASLPNNYTNAPIINPVRVVTKIHKPIIAIMKPHKCRSCGRRYETPHLSNMCDCNIPL